jgi:hypothetical protein
MRADFHLLRQSALGVCGAAFLGFALGGCASSNKPRFWDQQDVKTSADPFSSQIAVTSPTDPAAVKPASTVVAADHTTTPDSSGHVAASDFADAPPTPPAAQNPASADSQPPAPPTSAASGTQSVVPSATPTTSADGFDEPKTSASAPAKTNSPPGANGLFADPIVATPAAQIVAPASPRPAAPISESGTSSTAVAPAAPSGRSADAFAETGNSVFAGKGQAQPAVPPAAPQSTASSEMLPPSRPNPIDAQPAAPPSAEMVSIPPAAAAAPASKSEVAVNASRHDGVDPFAETQPSASTKPAAAPVTATPVTAAIVEPNCSAPAASMPAAAADAMPATPATTQQSGAPAAKAPSHAPASAEQAADFETPITVPQVAKQVVATSKSTVESKPAAVTTNAKSAFDDAPSLDGKDMEWTRTPGADRKANVADAMIIDSTSVRGRYTGIDHPKKSKIAKPATQSEVTSQPASQPTTPAKLPATPPAPVAAPPVASPAPMPTPPSQPESAPNLETDGAFAPSTPSVPAAGQTSHEPVHKPLSGVVNAVAQQVSPPAGADPFALEQAEASAVESSKSPKPHALASVNVAQEMDPFGEPSLLGANQTLSAESTAVAPIATHAWPAIRSEIAFVIGLAVGLSTALVVWLRSRLRKVEVPNV